MESVSTPLFVDIERPEQMQALKSAIESLAESGTQAGQVFGGTCVVIGNFDGVHLGHQALFREAVASGKNMGAGARPVVALTFDPHPRECFGLPHERLLQTRERVSLLYDAGAALVVVLRFSRELAALSPDAFVQNILVQMLQARVLVLGHDFVLGHDREGSAEVLSALGQTYGFSVCRVPALRDEAGRVISSSLLRELLRAGNVQGAARLMGRPHRVSGTVESGFQRGRLLGFPTANLKLAHTTSILPAVGVYATTARLSGQSFLYPSVTNIGRNPTFDNTQLTVETHVLDFEGDLYNQPFTVYFHHHIRGEIKFASLDELKAQIQADTAQARLLLKL